MKKIFYCLVAVSLMWACTSEPDDPIYNEMKQYAKEHIDAPDSYKFDEIDLVFEYTYNTPLVIYREKLLDEMEKPGADVAALRAEDDQLQVLFDELGYTKVCFEYHLSFWCKDPATGEKQNRIVKARYDTDGKLMKMIITPESFSDDPAVQILKDQGRLDFCSHPEWFPTYQY